MDAQLEELFRDPGRPTSEVRPQLQKLSHKHEAIMLFMLANPDMSKGDVAKHFGITQAWLSTVITSDAFAAKFGELRDQYMGTALLGLLDKVELLAHMSLDKMIEELPHTQGMGQAQSVANDTLKVLGYGSPKAGTTIIGGNVQVNQVTPDIMRRANEKRLAAARMQGESIDETDQALRFQASGQRDLGGTSAVPGVPREEALEASYERHEEGGDSL